MFSKTITLCSLVLLIISCKQNYVKHSVKLEKISEDCGSIDPATHIEANAVGERYVFEGCFDASGKYDYTVENKNDTLKVGFVRGEGPKSKYKVTLDIQAEPAYHWAEIDGSIFSVNISR